MQIPMSAPDITSAEIEAVNGVLQTPHLSIGPWVRDFEEEMQRYLGVRHAVAVSNGTTALHLAVIAAGVCGGDEVITTPFSFIASANCVLYEGARPVFVDIDPETLNINTEMIEAAVTPRTKTVLPVHVFGQPAEMDAILRIARAHNLAVIEDACEAIGAEYKGRKAGTLGDVAAFGFYPNKQMTTGEGGMIVTDREEWDVLFRSLRNQGRDVFDAWLNHTRLGYNYRLDEMSAALGLAQLRRIEELLSKRERVARLYNERLAEVAGVTIPHAAATTTRSSWFIYVIRLAPEIDRNRVMAGLERMGVPSRPYFVPIHLQPFYRDRFGYREGDFPVTESVARATLALPFSGVMTEDQVDHVFRGLRSLL